MLQIINNHINFFIESKLNRIQKNTILLYLDTLSEKRQIAKYRIKNNEYRNIDQIFKSLKNNDNNNLLSKVTADTDKIYNLKSNIHLHLIDNKSDHSEDKGNISIIIFIVFLIIIILFIKIFIININKISHRWKKETEIKSKIKSELKK